MQVNGEAVAVAANGTFTKTLLVGQRGLELPRARATDSSGNEATRRQRVFVETL